MQKAMTEEDIIELIISESKKIQSTLNDKFLLDFSKLHNIPKEHNYLNAKQEVVARSAFFQDVKKKYALYIVNEEEVPVSKMMVRGISTQRSDYPRITRDRLLTLLNMLVGEKKVSFTKIRNFIDSTTEELRGLCMVGDKRAGRPVSFSKEVASYKKIPAHVEAMLFWNKVCYNHFVPGTKGYSFRINGIDIEKCPPEAKKVVAKLEKIGNWIVIPLDEERVPEWIALDVNYQVKSIWLDRVSELLRSIWDMIYSGDEFKKQEISLW